MSEESAPELVRLCESILADGEITAEEVVNLGKWLAEHTEAAQSWAGAILSDPIQKIVRDGKVNKTEPRTAGRVIREVQKQWAKRQAGGLRQEALEKVRCAVGTMDPFRAALPSIAISIAVKSQSDPSLSYEVDLSGPSCTCPDWRSYRSGLPLGDLTRCCKHVFAAFACVRPRDGWPIWVGAFLEQGWKPHPQRKWSVVDLGGACALLGVGGSDWADVFASMGGHYQRFGFNLAERRWSYGVAPTSASEIQRALVRQSRGASAGGGLLRRLFGI